MKRSMVIALVLASAACAINTKHRPGPQPPAMAATPSVQPENRARNGYGEDAYCPYVFTREDSKKYEDVLTEVSAGTQCKFDGAQGQYTMMIGTWIMPNDKKVSMQFFSGTCGSSPGQVAAKPLVVAAEEELKRTCADTYDAAVRAAEDGRLPRPEKRKDAVTW